MRAAMSNTPATSVSWSAKIALTNPAACASVAVQRRPVYASSRTMPSGTSFGIRCSVPTSAVMPMSISAIEKKVDSVAYRMSAAQTRSTPPPTHPPWIAASTGTRDRSRHVNVSCSRIAVLRNRSLPRLRWLCPPPAPSVSLLVNTSRSIPEQKCGPVLDTTIARTEPDAENPSTISGSSRQNAAIIELRFSGRFIRTCATRSLTSTSKHSYPTTPPHTRSMMIAGAIPPPAHIVIRPNCPSVRSSSSSTVPIRIAPVAPMG